MKMHSSENSLYNYFGINTFGQKDFKRYLSPEELVTFHLVQSGEVELSQDLADVIANSFKEWALERGATHFTHWFQPLNGLTAEKHDSFLAVDKDGDIITLFSGKDLIKGEPDASSFPSGGLRTTFEARGYTAWDFNSPVFLRENDNGSTLYIPTTFISYHGEALDKKTPLLKSINVLEKEALELLYKLGDTEATGVCVNVGIEQEYFLVKEEYAKKRLDLLLTDRTLLGAPSTKSQEAHFHYFGSMNDEIAAFMEELDVELWKLGICAKTKHNEVAPNQFEIASIYAPCNLSVDYNQITMDLIKKIARKHGFVALLHEKPFEYINGSGKHNNWSLSTNTGRNLLAPSDNQIEAIQFLLFLMAVVESVSLYAPQLQLSIASATNDLRLGGYEAPPSIISIFLGNELTHIIENIKTIEISEMTNILNKSLQHFKIDGSDRNRTSPFAFTGDKFEFRMVGSSSSSSTPNIFLNTIVASTIRKYRILLDGAINPMEKAKDIIANSFDSNKQIIFNGNGYDESWLELAKKRNLPNFSSTAELLPYYLDQGTIKLFEDFSILSARELESRYEAYSNLYIEKILLEASVLEKIIYKELVPQYKLFIQKEVAFFKDSLDFISDSSRADALSRIEDLYKLLDKLKTLLKNLTICGEKIHHALTTGDKLKLTSEELAPLLRLVRVEADKVEDLLPNDLLPYPTYDELLYQF